MPKKNLKFQRIVLTGGPSTGKTSIINFLKKKGHYCFDEISRQVIQEYQTKGIPQPFKTHPNEFSNQIFESRVQQFEKAKFTDKPVLFYDRGLPDVIAYMNSVNTKVFNYYQNETSSRKYSQIFIFPPWKEIYIKDTERFESFEEALTIHKALIKCYKNFGYLPIEVPFDTIENRGYFILNSIQ